MMNELLFTFFKSYFGFNAKRHLSKNRVYRYGDFIMHGGDCPLTKIKGKNYCLGIYKSEWRPADILFWKKVGATSFFDLNDTIESWKILFKGMVGGKSPFGTNSLEKKI